MTLLPHETPKATSWREVWTTIIGVIGLVLLINILAVGLLRFLTSNRGYFLISHKWQLLLQLEQPVDWLILGDSSCNQAVIPELLSADLGGTVLNGCTVGSVLAVNDAWMLEQHIRQVGAPKNVVLVHVYDIWPREIEDEAIGHLAKIPVSWRQLQQFEPSLDLEWDDASELFLQKYMPLYSANQTLAEWMLRPAHAWRKTSGFEVSETGFMAMNQPEPEVVLEDTQDHRGYVRSHSFSISEINRAALDRIQTLADEYEFNVYIANSPIHDKLYADREFRTYFRKMQQTLKQVTAESDRLHVILDRPVTIPLSQLQNTDHVLLPAAQTFTKELADAIQPAQ